MGHRLSEGHGGGGGGGGGGGVGVVWRWFFNGGCDLNDWFFD